MKISTLFLLLASFLFAGSITHPDNIQLTGELGDRADLVIKRFQHHPFDDVNFIVQDVARVEGLKRRFEEYEGDVSGRTLGSWSYYSQITGTHSKKLDKIAKEILKHQSPEGYFGIDQKTIGWDFWGRQTFGHGRLLGGLLQYYRLNGNENVLDAAVKLGDYFCADLNTWTNAFSDNPWTNDVDKTSWGGPENRQKFVKTHMTSILESLVMLYEETHNETYLRAGEEIVSLFPEFGQYHAHSYLNSMTGMAMLYYHTRDEKLYDKLTSLYWHDVVAHGNKKEGINWEWFPHDHRTEGCTITDWIRLNLYMWQATLDPVYLEAAENSWYNSLYFHQTGQGAFGHAIMNEKGYENLYSQSWWCCTMHGLWAMTDIANFIAAESKNQLWINFYEPAEIDLPSAKINMQSEYPQAGNINIQLFPKNKDFTVNLRIPKWARDVKILVNDKSEPAIKKNGYISITRQWEKGDKIHLQFPITLRLVDEHNREILNLRKTPKEPIQAYFYHGPLILSNTKKPDAKFPTTIFFTKGKDYQLETKPAQFILPQAHYMLPSTIDPGIKNVITTVILAPMSERTTDTKWQEEWQGFKRNGETPISRPETQILHQILIK